MQRRILFKLGLASAAALALAGGAAGWRLQASLQPDGRLWASGCEMFSAVGRAVLDRCLQAQGDQHHKALAGLHEALQAMRRSWPVLGQQSHAALHDIVAAAGLPRPGQNMKPVFFAMKTHA